jgi:hypothetical protein
MTRVNALLEQGGSGSRLSIVRRTSAVATMNTINKTSRTSIIGVTFGSAGTSLFIGGSIGVSTRVRRAR